MSRHLENRSSNRNPERLPGAIVLKRLSPFFDSDTLPNLNSLRKRGIRIAKTLEGEVFDRVRPSSRKQKLEQGIDFFGIVRIRIMNLVKK